MAALALLPDVIYSQIHPLSEIAATVPYLLALIWIDRRHFLAGMALGFSFGLRFQMGFLIAAIVTLMWAQQRFRIDRPLLRMAGGLAIALMGLGLCDRIIFGDWFHSPITYYTANMIEGVANVWGVEPWYQYFLWLGEPSWLIFALAAAIALVGAIREWRLGLLVVGFTVPHMLVGHKEARFLLPILPIALCLGAVGVSQVCRLLGRWQRRAVLALATAALAAAAVVRLPEIAWNSDPFRAQAHLLHLAGQRDDLTGLAIFGYDHGNCANYFYLRRNVPLHAAAEPDLDAMKPPARDPRKRLNYIICWASYRDRYAIFGPVEIATCNSFGLYRLESPASLPQE
jgi:hypothetical protein